MDKNKGNIVIELRGTGTQEYESIGTAGLSYVRVFSVNPARRRVIAKYEPMVQQSLTNIENLSAGISAAREELRSLGYEE